jgi:hypothetical protein
VPKYNTQPTPRVLFEALPAEILEKLTGLVGSWRSVTAEEEVHESEYDVLVSFAADVDRRSPELHVLSFGATRLKSGAMGLGIIKDMATTASEIAVPDELPTHEQELLANTVVPHISAGDKKVWRRAFFDGAGFKSTTDRTLSGACEALVAVGPEAYLYALKMRRGDDGLGGLLYSLPPETTGHASWLAAFLAELDERGLLAASNQAGWREATKWAPKYLVEQMDAFERINQERELLLAEMSARQIEACDAIVEASNRAESSEWRLLSADGDSLVNAVATELRKFGFEVAEGDVAQRANEAALLEDLIVRYPARPEWECLVEVKGYKAGAKVNDVRQVAGRPSIAYAAREGRAPDAVWHVVNAWRFRDPSSRPTAIPNEAVDLAVLTEVNGALIDTRDLFTRGRAVDLGEISAESVAAEMMAAVTRWPSLN